MQQYRLSEQKVRSIVRSPKRVEIGTDDGVVCVMKPPSTRRRDGKETWSQEVWVAYKAKSKKCKVKSVEKMKNEELGMENERGVAFGGSSRVSTLSQSLLLSDEEIVILSVWRFLGVSKIGTIPEDEGFEE